MYMQVKDVLSCGCSVLLDNAYAVGFGGFLNSRCNVLRDLVRGCKNLIWRVENVYVVLFGDDERVSLAYRADIHERHYLVVFVDYAGGGFFSDYFAENAAFTHVYTQYGCLASTGFRCGL